MNGKNPIPYTVILGSLGEIKSSQRFWCPVHTCRRKFERYRFYETINCFEFQLWGFCWNFLKVTAKSNGNSNSFSYLLTIWVSIYVQHLVQGNDNLMVNYIENNFLSHVVYRWVGDKVKKPCQQLCNVTEAMRDVECRENTKEGQLKEGQTWGSEMLSKGSDKS